MSIVSIYAAGIKVVFFYHTNEFRLTMIGRISSCGLVLYVFIVPMKRNITVLFNHPKENMWFSYFKHRFEISILDPSSSKFVLLNQVSGFVGGI